MKIKYESKEIILKIEKKTNAAIHIQDLMSGQPISLLLYFFFKKNRFILNRFDQIYIINT